uniref:Protein tyrosine phosphatase non-receptor type 23 n=1 Tax=Anser brachyrhynchus TaxID=132585 RepID=A0A8B9BJM3_9AVES
TEGNRRMPCCWQTKCSRLQERELPRRGGFFFVLKNYGENPENYNEELRKLEVLRQNAVNVPRDFEGCSTLRKYFGQLHYLQSRIPMGAEQEAAVPIAWTEIFSGKTVTHEDIKYEQACVLYNLGALHSMLGAMDKRVSEEGMKVSCTHFQCAAGAFTYLRDHFPHSYSVDMSHQILNLNINLMLGQAQECLLEKSMLDNRKSFLVARISAQVVDYYKEACRALENSETASLLGKIQKDWKKLVQMKIYYFAAVAHVRAGVIYFQSALDKLNEAIKLAKVRSFSLWQQELLYNSAKKDNDFIYHEAVPALDTLQAVKGAPLVKALPVNPTDPAVTGPDIFAKLVPMAAHEASSLYSEEKAKLLRDVMAKIEAKNEVLDQFMDSMQLDPETVDNLDMYSHIPPVLMEKCAALSVRPDTVKNLVQSMQVLSGVFTDVEASLKEIRDLLEEDEAQERKLRELLGKGPAPRGSPPPPSAGLAEVSKECSKYLEVHEKASFTNTELHKAMNLHIGNLRLLSGPLEQVRAALPSPALTEDDKQVLQNLKRILVKVQEMRDQRVSLEQQLREMIQKDDITTSLVTADRSEMKKLFEEQLKKYDQIKVYLEQNLAAQENILKALTDANVKYAAVRKALAEVEHKWNTTVQTLVASYEAYEDLMKKSQEGKDFYTDLEGKAAKLLEKARAACQAAEANRQQILEKEMKKQPPPRPTAPKPALQKKPPELDAGGPEAAEVPQLGSLGLAQLPEELRSLPPDVLAGHLARLPPSTLAALPFAPPRFPALPGHYAAVPASAPGAFPHGSGAPVLPAQLLQPSAPQAAPQLFPAAPLARGAAQPGYAGPHALPPRSSPQHGPAASYGLGQAGLPVPGPLRPPAMGPAPVGAQPPPMGGPEQQGPAARPATTTVDSIQAPISSCAAPPRLPSQGPAVPPGGFLPPQRPGAPPASFPYGGPLLSKGPFTPPRGLPDSKGSLLRFIQEVHGHYLHQRPLHTPVVVHCSSGVGRTGAFCLLYAAMQEVEAGNGIPDLAQLVKRLRQQRKHMLQEKLHLKFCYEAVLQHAEQVLHRHGVGMPPVPKPPNSTSPKVGLYFHQDPQDLVLGGDLSISSIQATIAKLSIKPAGVGGEIGGAWGPDPAPGPHPALGPHPAPGPHPVPGPDPAPLAPKPPAAEPPAPPASAPSSSSLELLASLTPEAFTLDASLKGKQRMNKQNFLQAQTGEGLRGPRPTDDPLTPHYLLAACCANKTRPCCVSK